MPAGFAGSFSAASSPRVASTIAFAQSLATGTSNVAHPDLTIVQVVQDARQNYPAIHVSEQDLNAAVANIRLARTSYLPRLDGIVEVNRATRNNVFGTLLPQNTLPSMSGPVIGTNNAGSGGAARPGL